MSKLDLLKTIASKVTTNAGVAVIDSITMGIGSSFKKSSDEIAAYTKLTNEALYYMQVKTFLETTNLNQEEVTDFFEKNTDNQRLGLEVFKILESTYLEKQAQLIAIAFKKYVKGNIPNSSLYKYLHLIEQLDRHTVDIIEDDLESIERTLIALSAKKDEPKRNFISNSFSRTSIYPNALLEKLGFIEQKAIEQKISIQDIEKKARYNSDINLTPKFQYQRTRLYTEFYTNIYSEVKCIH